MTWRSIPSTGNYPPIMLKEGLLPSDNGEKAKKIDEILRAVYAGRR